MFWASKSSPIVIVVGLAWSTACSCGGAEEEQCDSYKLRIGRSLLLGVEIVIPADIVKTIAADLR